MIDPVTFAKWQDWSKRDDACNLFVPSDIRQMLGEVARLRAETTGSGTVIALLGSMLGTSLGVNILLAFLPL